MDNNGKEKIHRSERKGKKKCGKGSIGTRMKQNTLRKESGEQEEEKGRQDKIADSERFS
jgi:hypothetical protein